MCEEDGKAGPKAARDNRDGAPVRAHESDAVKHGIIRVVPRESHVPWRMRGFFYICGNLYSSR